MKFDSIDFIKKLVSFKTVSANKECAKDIKNCAVFLNDFFKSHSFDSEIIQTNLHPIVFAKKNCKSGKPKARILCYGHYDVQPVEPIEKWNTNPFEVVEKNGKLCGRGCADNKGPFTALIAGYINFAEKNKNADLDIAFLLEGEEEISSPSMDNFIRQNAKELSTYDIVLLSDTMSPSNNQILVTTGVRGMVAFQATFTGSNCDLHSGLYGGLVYNPIQAMSEVCASLHNSDGLVNIDSFYDDVSLPQEWEKDEIKKLSITEESVKKLLGLNALYSQKGVSPLESTRLMPTLEFNGIGGGYQGDGVKTVIASECFCKISCRLVPNQNPEKILKLVQNAMLQRCPKGVQLSFQMCESFANAYFIDAKESISKKDIKCKIFESLKESVSESFGCQPLFVRDGGSISLVGLMHELANLDFIMTGLFTPEDNLHAPNESFYIDMLEKGSKLYELLFEKISK